MIEEMDPNEKSGRRNKDQNPQSNTPVLDNFSRDLIKLAEKGKLDPVIGRDQEIARIAQILSRRKKNNPIIIGEPGCGKTAIVEGLAMKIFQGECPQNLCDKRIVSLDMTSIVAGTKYRGQFDSNIFKPALARGELQCIGATTLDEYRENIEKDGALERRFQKVLVDAASPEETLQILNNIKDRYEAHHKVEYSKESLEACVYLADRYITDREFPDKGIDIMDEVGARSQINVKLPEEIEQLKLKASDIKEQKLLVVKKQNYEEAAHLRDKEKKILKQLEDAKKDFELKQNTQRKLITEEMVYEVVSLMTKIPVNKLSQKEMEGLLELENSLKMNVIGQDSAVTKKHSMSRLIGSPPGYVGFNEGGQLTEAVKNKPYSVVLFDEIEKANKDIFSLLLQVLDDGHLTDGMGRKINFKNCIIIMTSNIGVKKLQDFGTGVGFETSSRMSSNEDLKVQLLQKELKSYFTPEFLNRLDEVVMFSSLGEVEVKQIVNIELSKLTKRLNRLGYHVDFDESLHMFLAKVGFDEKYGARPIKRAIQEKVEDFISEEVLRSNIKIGGHYQLTVTDEVVTLTSKEEEVIEGGN